ncbi:hypothetical protein Agub_g7539 [Astrephomene gubernaculifera]|uniref:AAA+ ATPase domain-containing protein n=1 Tax=Astrephomene gubernaculifera TaxID=47775 RepID=A0AAD3DRY3_9CHLO|nr:hypothetical protein Agub_g7539 [Astrephomene gubernaculifera]
MSKDKEERRPLQRPESSLLYSSGSWRPPGGLGLLPTPLNSLGRQPSGVRALRSAATRREASQATVNPLPPTPRAVPSSLLASASRAIDEADLFHPFEVIGNAYVNSATVEERAIEKEMQRQTLLFTDQPRVTRPNLAALLSNIPITAGNGGSGIPGSPAADGYTADAVADAFGGGISTGGLGLSMAGFDAIPEETSAASLQYAADSPLRFAAAAAAGAAGAAMEAAGGPMASAAAATPTAGLGLSNGVDSGGGRNSPEGTAAALNRQQPPASPLQRPPTAKLQQQQTAAPMTPRKTTTGGDPWFGPPSANIGKTSSGVWQRPLSGRPASGVPSSRPVSALGGAGGVGGQRTSPARPDWEDTVTAAYRRRAESPPGPSTFRQPLRPPSASVGGVNGGRRVSSTRPEWEDSVTATYRRRAESPPGPSIFRQPLRQPSATANGGGVGSRRASASASSLAAAARPVSAPRSYGRLGRSVSAHLDAAVSATTAAAGGVSGVLRGGARRPLSALPQQATAATAAATAGTITTPMASFRQASLLSPRVITSPERSPQPPPPQPPPPLQPPPSQPSRQQQSEEQVRQQPQQPSGTMSPTRRQPTSPPRAAAVGASSWMLTRAGSPPGRDGSPSPPRRPPSAVATARSRPTSALSIAGGGNVPPVIAAAAAAAAATVADSMGPPPVSYRPRNEFLYSGKKIPNSIRPFSAFSTLGSAAMAVAAASDDPTSPTNFAAMANDAGMGALMKELYEQQPVYHGGDGPIRTSYDVVEYYAKQGQNAQIKLFYLNARKPSGPLDVVSPFDLVVVPYERIDRTVYWTMSALGVVQVEQGRSDEGEFTPLGEWIRLTSVYGLLRKLRFFRHFLLCRTFQRWRRNVNRRGYERMRRRLAGRLLAGSPIFQPLLLRAGQVLQTMRETAVVAITSRLDRLYSLEEFVGEQDHRRTAVAAPQLSVQVQQLCNELIAVGSRVISERERMERRIDIAALKANAVVTSIPRGGGGGGSRSGSAERRRKRAVMGVAGISEGEGGDEEGEEEDEEQEGGVVPLPLLGGMFGAATGGGGSGGGAGHGIPAYKAKSISALKAEKATILARHEAWVACEARIPSVVRLLDYLVASTAVELGVRGTRELLSYLDNPAKTRGVLSVTVSFEPPPNHHHNHHGHNHLLQNHNNHHSHHNSPNHHSSVSHNARSSTASTLSFSTATLTATTAATDALMANTGFGFSPQLRQVTEGLMHVMDSLVTMLSEMPRPSSYKPVVNRYVGSREMFMNVADIIRREHPQYKDLRSAVLEHADTSYHKALDYVRATFEDKRPIFEFSLAWDVVSYASACETAIAAAAASAAVATDFVVGNSSSSNDGNAATGGGGGKLMMAAAAAGVLSGSSSSSSSELLLQTFRKDLMQQRRWKRQVEQMKMSNTVGILFVDSKKMRAGLQDSIERTLEDLKGCLVSSARRAVAISQEQLRFWSRELDPRPADLDGYAKMRELYDNLLLVRDSAYKAVDVAAEMYDLYRDYGGRTDVKDAVALETMHELALQVRGQIHDLGVWVRDRATAMTMDLRAAIQDLSASIVQLLNDLTNPALADPDSDVGEILDAISRLGVRLEEIEEDNRRFIHYQRLFDLAPEEPSNLVLARREFGRRQAAWNTLAEWSDRTATWLHSPCTTLDAEAVIAAIDEFHRSAYRMAKTAREDPVVAKLKDDIEAFRRFTQLFTDACNPALQPHHWEQILALMGRPGELDPDDPITIADLIEWGALDNAEALSAISGAASKELSLRSALRRMKQEWEGVVFQMVPYKDTGTYVVGHTDEIQMQLDEQLMKVQAMNAAPFVKPFQKEAEEWQATLEGLGELLEGWLACQATWMYLEPIFSSPDIVKQMPAEGEKFAQVDVTFRLLVDDVVAAPGAIALAKDADRRVALGMANRLLDEVQHGLSRYLEMKRLLFPRFFFLSNDEMLEILSETKDPTRVQPHLRKCFEGIHRLHFEPGTNGHVTAMLSLEGERVSFLQYINTAAARGQVEQWLVEVESSMFEAVHDVTGKGIADYAASVRNAATTAAAAAGTASTATAGAGSGSSGGDGGSSSRGADADGAEDGGAAAAAAAAAAAEAAGGRREWALRWPGMVVLLAAGVFWTRGVEEAIAAGKLKEFEEQCTGELREIVDLVRGNLTSLQRATLGALVVMDVHGRDVVTGLAEARVAAASEFDWQAQLRAYWQPGDGKPIPGQPEREFTARCCMMSASLEYGYEYLGNSSRLVITPLTDRCYRTLMGAIHLNLGGAPEGPAGTGKTETTKDLAKAMARQCVVFNCSDTLNHLDMAKFFKGLAAAGAWACFDEFNRIDLEVLSVVAQQVLEIQRAIASRLTVFSFEGTELPLKWSAWVAITMNPGYAGRTELPDNLKALFRSVAMMVPDYAMIAEIILYSYGYMAARPAAKKIVACYKLCSEQLSSQDHYDYGMRAVMAVLRAAGNLKRTATASASTTSTAAIPAKELSQEEQETEELQLILRSIVDVNLCKFLSHDVPLFNGIVSDLFPGISLPRTNYGPLAAALRSACEDANLQPTEYFLLKATQLYEMVLVRHGLMLVGQPFSGKTSAYRVLAAALTRVAEDRAAMSRQSSSRYHQRSNSSHHLARNQSSRLHRLASTKQGQGQQQGQGVGGPGGEGGSSDSSNPHAHQVRASAFVLNPKAVTMGQLYGQTDPASQEWTDGVLAVLFRHAAADPSPDRKWLVLDGPVDAIWVENMNTVLDDNKKLCLNSGEIIAMSPPMNLIFEVGDLAVASPATVSRCGMVYLEPHQLGTAPLLSSWLAALPGHMGGSGAGAGGAGGDTGAVAGAAGNFEGGGAAPEAGGAESPPKSPTAVMGGMSAAAAAAAAAAVAAATAAAAAAAGSGVRPRLTALFEGLVMPTIRFVRREVKEAAPSLDANLAMSWMRLTEAMLIPVIGTPDLLLKASAEGRLSALVDGAGLMALVWAVGSTAATQECRTLVDGFIRRALSGTLAGLEVPSGRHYGITDAPVVPLLSPAAVPPEKGLLYDYMFDMSEGIWVSWTARFASGSPAIPPDAAYGSILVPTADTAAVSYLLSTAIGAKYPFLLIGPTGTGKSLTITRLLLGLEPATFAAPNFLGFSGQTSANTTQGLIDAKLEKRRRGVYGPVGGRRGVVFVDDLNMPQRELYGAQPPIELLRQLLDHGGWYGRDNSFHTIQDTLLVAAMCPPGGGRAPVTSRFTRHFSWLCLPEASRATLTHIFSTIHGWFLTTRAFPPAIVELRDSVIAATLEVYGTVAAQLLPTPSRSHYTFNLRDCSRVVQGMQAQDAKALQRSVDIMRPYISRTAAAPPAGDMYGHNANGFEDNGGGNGSISNTSNYHNIHANNLALREAHVRLWVHEVLRVFYDRLVDVSEQQWFLQLLGRLVSTHFDVQLDELLTHLADEEQSAAAAAAGAGAAAREGAAVNPDTIRRCLFGDYMTEGDEEGPRPYLEIPRPTTNAVSRLEDLQADYNGLATGGRQHLKLAIFLYAVEHVTRIARVLRQEGGHVLCVGVGGSGRQSLARLAAFTCGMDVFQVEIARGYGLNEWHDDLRRLARRAGAEGRPTVFLFGDSQATQESFVEDVNSLLNSGEVPNLFPSDERIAICEAVRPAAQRAAAAAAAAAFAAATEAHINGTADKQQQATATSGSTSSSSGSSGHDTPAALWAFFISRCRANLHVVLAFSPAGDAFRERLRKFPSLVNCCTIDWFHAWPDDALEAVAAKLLSEADMHKSLLVPIKGLCKTFHAQVSTVSDQFCRETGRYNYITPTSYLELISSFVRLLAQRKAKVLGEQQKYENGLQKLQSTADQISTMRNELKDLGPVLTRTVAETEQLMKEIAREKEQVVEPQRALVDSEVREADKTAAAARTIKEECETILSEALPALEAATQALDTIKAADIKLVQTFKSPPAAVKLVLEAVCVLLDVKPTLLPDPNVPGRKLVDWWDASKRLLMDPTLIPRLKEYDRDNIPQKIIDKVRREYTGDPEFTPANAAKASSAAEGLCKWVHAMDQYDRVAKVVAPKRAALLEAESKYNAVLSGLHGKQAELREVQERLERLEARLAESQERKAKLEAEIATCAVKLERAEQLLGGLGGERERWHTSATRLRALQGALAGDMLLAAGAVAYLGAFTMPYRDRTLALWSAAVEAAAVRTSASMAPAAAAATSGGGDGDGEGGGGSSGATGFSLTAALGDPVTIRDWVIHGLPNDSFSIDSALIAAASRRWPLCIDPQGQANRWIKAMNESSKIKVLKQSDPSYLRSLESAVSLGLPVLLEGVGQELDPSLDPLLLRQTFKQGPTLVVRLGDNLVEYSHDFRLYMTTTLRNPHYLPETAVKVTLLNFMITPEGLTDQLLGVAVAAEEPQLEDQRQTLVVSGAENARQLAEIEARILAVMSATEGDILEDASAVGVLSESKRLSNDISAKQAVAERTQAALDAARRRYGPVAEVAATVFFAIADLAGVNPMYQYSLGWFIGLFIKSIRNSATEAAAATAAAAAAAAANSVTPSIYGGGLGGPLGGAGGGGGAGGPFGGGGAGSGGGLEGAALEARLATIEKHFLLSTYRNVSRSLFDRHKRLLSVLLATRLAQRRGKLGPPEHLRFLMHGAGATGTAAGAASAARPSAAGGSPVRSRSSTATGGGDMSGGREGLLGQPPAGIPERAWAEVHALAAMPDGSFSSLPTHMAIKAEEWAALVDAADPHVWPLPDPVGSMLTPFQRLLVLRCLRPDKLLPALERWVAAELGPAFISPPPLDLEAALQEAAEDGNVATPMLVVLAPGSDPWVTILRCAEAHGQASKLQVISLGQGQGPRAEALIAAARRMGHWVLLQNCHLAPSWMPTLEQCWEALRAETTTSGTAGSAGSSGGGSGSMEPGFRLWLTSAPSAAFPTSMLTAAVKVTWEPPAGLQSNMLRSMGMEPLSDPAFWENRHHAAIDGKKDDPSDRQQARPGQPFQQQQQQRPSFKRGGSRRQSGGNTSVRGGAGGSGGVGSSSSKKRHNSSATGATGAARSPSPPTLPPWHEAEDDAQSGAYGDSKDPRLRRLLFGLVFLHAVVQERRRYGPIGWNVPYGFDDGDLRISARQMRMYVMDCTARGNPLPYAALRYAIGECNYGGRVTDDRDRQLLSTLLRRLVSPEVAERPGNVLLATSQPSSTDNFDGGGANGNGYSDGFSFNPVGGGSISFRERRGSVESRGSRGSGEGGGGGVGPPAPAIDATEAAQAAAMSSSAVSRVAATSVGVCVPPDEGGVQGYTSYISSLPSSVLPEVFGLHLNADIAKDLSTTAELLSSLAATNSSISNGNRGSSSNSSGSTKDRSSSSGGGSSSSSAVAEGVGELLDRLPPDFDTEAAAAAFPVLYHQSLNQVLIQEMVRYNRLLSVLRSSLTQLSAALAGRQVMSADLEGLMADVAAGKMPNAWKPHSYPSLKPLASFITDLRQRTGFLSDWVAERAPPAAFWLGAFFFPPAFTTAALQNFARHHVLPIDAVGFDYEVLRVQDACSLTSPPGSGVYVYGLHLEGAGWDRFGCCLSEPAPKQLHCPAPPIWFKPVKVADMRPSASYDCPVYRTSERRGTLATTGHSTNFLLSLKLPLDTTAARPRTHGSVGGGAGGGDAEEEEAQWQAQLQRLRDHWVLRGVCALVSLPE